jgi:hypothetical protein
MIAGASTIELGTESKWQIGLPSVAASPTGVYELATTLEMLQEKLTQTLSNARHTDGGFVPSRSAHDGAINSQERLTPPA